MSLPNGVQGQRTTIAKMNFEHLTLNFESDLRTGGLCQNVKYKGLESAFNLIPSHLCYFFVSSYETSFVLPEYSAIGMTC